VKTFYANWEHADATDRSGLCYSHWLPRASAEASLHCTQLSHHQPSIYKVHRLSHNTMASTPITASTSSNFEAIINGALTKYASQTGHDLRNHPLASEIDRCDSAESILVIFQEQAKAFHEFRNDDPKLIKCLQPVVSGLYILSASPALSTGVSLVSPSNSFCSLTVFSNGVVM